MHSEKYDLIVFGSTGFTGRLVAEYLQLQYGVNNGDINADSNTDNKTDNKEQAVERLNWAMAGRSMEKLKQVRNEIGVSKDIDLILADSDNQDSLDSLVASTKVVLTTVGPYQLYGEKLLETVVRLGKCYVDLCGEPAWMHQMINKYQSMAIKNNAHIVFSCGFDSIPFDLGVYFLQQHVVKVTSTPLAYIKGRVRKMHGRFSGGTAASLKATLAAAKRDKSIMQSLINPYSLADSAVMVEQPRGDTPYYDEKLGSWVAPFIMAAINTKNVHRSNFLLNYAYGKDFQYDEMILTGDGKKGEATANHVANDKSLSGDDAPKPGEGPSKEERENGYYDILFIGEHANGNTFAASVAGDLDPGYGSTSKMITESAICLALKKSDLKGGFYTSAPALGEALIERLQKYAGLVFKIEKY